MHVRALTCPYLANLSHLAISTCSFVSYSVRLPLHACRSEIEIVERIFDRVLGSSSDNQHLVGLAGCVAVANRNHLDHVSLVEADVEERCYFQAMLDDPAEAYAPVEVQQKLRDNMTIKKLIVKLDSLFHNFIVMRWKPAALTFLSPLQEQAQVSGNPSLPCIFELGKKQFCSLSKTKCLIVL